MSEWALQQCSATALLIAQNLFQQRETTDRHNGIILLPF